MVVKYGGKQPSVSHKPKKIAPFLYRRLSFFQKTLDKKC